MDSTDAIHDAALAITDALAVIVGQGRALTSVGPILWRKYLLAAIERKVETRFAGRAFCRTGSNIRDGKEAAPRFTRYEGLGQLPTVENPEMKMVVKSPLALMALAGVFVACLGSVAFTQDSPMSGPERMMNFEAMDANKDGKITPDELAAYRAARMAEADLNKDGMISAEEIVAFGDKMQAERKLHRAQEMIARFDTNKDGQLAKDEMPAPKDPSKMFSRVDTDGDGAISKAEADAMTAKMADRMGKHGKGKHDGKGHSGFWFWGDDAN